jgi:hypothetical protein
VPKISPGLLSESARLSWHDDRVICFVLAVLASPFKSKSRLEAENAVLRHQLIVLRRRMRGKFSSAYQQRPLVPRPDVSIVSIDPEGRYDCRT